MQGDKENDRNIFVYKRERARHVGRATKGRIDGEGCVDSEIARSSKQMCARGYCNNCPIRRIDGTWRHEVGIARHRHAE